MSTCINQTKLSLNLNYSRHKSLTSTEMFSSRSSSSFSVVSPPSLAALSPSLRWLEISLLSSSGLNFPAYLSRSKKVTCLWFCPMSPFTYFCTFASMNFLRSISSDCNLIFFSRFTSCWSFFTRRFCYYILLYIRELPLLEIA